MPIPTYDQFIEPILRYLAANPSGAAAKDVHDAAAATLAIPDTDKQELLPSGTQVVYKNRAGWAHDRLKRAGLSSSPRRGYWRLTEEGDRLRANAPGSVVGVRGRKAGLRLHRCTTPARGHDRSYRYSPESAASPAAVAPTLASPDERLGLALSELRGKVVQELREALGKASPSFFESIVLELLHRMGYGASRADLQRVGGSGDGGIDGIISLDKLGLEKVYVQAKRWQQSVGRPEIQGFYGALAGNRANKGVFITTSDFTQQAREFARSVERVVLVDGDKLAELMIDHEVGVAARTIKVPRLDGDFFDEESA